MDPNQTLKEIRALVREIFNTDDPARELLAGQELAEKIEALDRWLEGGGFLPTGWQAARREAKR